VDQGAVARSGTVGTVERRTRLSTVCDWRAQTRKRFTISPNSGKEFLNVNP
jgi:hypothetical protein